MYEPGVSFDTPSDETVVWRYMPLVQLLDLLSTSELHFTPLSEMEDPWEGHLPFSHMKAQVPGDMPEHSLLEGTKAINERARRTPVSCWHIARAESELLWARYSDRQTGVAIKSTVGRLKLSMRDDPRKIMIGTISYLDYEAGEQFIRLGNMYNQVMCKREEFALDRELRLAALIAWEHTGGVRVAVKPNDLITSVTLSPDAKHWTLHVVKKVCIALGFSGEIRLSSLSSSPK